MEDKTESAGTGFKGKLARVVAALGLFGLTLGTGAAVKAGMDSLSSQPTISQQEAAKQLSRTNIERFEFIVKNDPDVVKLGGLAVRKEPQVPGKDAEEVPVTRLQPGDKITGIHWPGKLPTDPNWVAFQNDQGQILFANTRYLDQVVNLPEPQTGLPAKP